MSKKILHAFTLLVLALPTFAFAATGQDIRISSPSGSSLASSTVSVTRNDTTRLYLFWGTDPYPMKETLGTPSVSNPGSTLCGYARYFNEAPGGTGANITNLPISALYGSHSASATCPKPDQAADWYLITIDLADDGRWLSTSTHYTTTGPSKYTSLLTTTGGGGGSSGTTSVSATVNVDKEGDYLFYGFILYLSTTIWVVWLFAKRKI